MNRIKQQLMRIRASERYRTFDSMVDADSFRVIQAALSAKTRAERLTAVARLVQVVANEILLPHSVEDLAEALEATAIKIDSRRTWRAIQDISCNTDRYGDLRCLRLAPLPGIFAIRWEYQDAADSQWFATSPEAEARLRQHVGDRSWEIGDHLTLLREHADDGLPRPVGYGDARFGPTPAAGTYVGVPGPAEIAADIVPDSTTLLVGPSGCGKTTLARLACDHLPWVKRSLTVPGNRLGDMFDALREMRPDLLIIDDVPLSHHVDSNMLSAMENLRPYVGATMLTFMFDGDESRFLKRGGLYWPGMRPGRIDRIILLHRPDTEQRRAILAAYLPTVAADVIDEMTAGSDGMTGAYLKTLADEVNRCGLDRWQERLLMLTYQMPVGRESLTKNDDY